MDNERAEKSTHVKPEFGSNGYFCIELFCDSSNLTFAMKRFFPDCFGVDHKVAKQRVKVICLDLTRESWSPAGQLQVSACGCILAYPVGQHRRQGSSGLARSIMVRHL